MAAISKKFVDICTNSNRIPLEKNISSFRSSQHIEYCSYRPEFWNLLPEDYPILVGCDAHRIEEVCLSKKENLMCSSKRSVMHVI